MKSRSTNTIFCIIMILSFFLAAYAFAGTEDGLVPSEGWTPEPENVIYYQDNISFDLFSSNGNAQVQYHPQGTFPYKYSVSMVERMQVPDYMKKAVDVADLDINGRVTNNSKNEVRILLIVGNKRGIAKRPKEHIIISGTIPGGQSTDLTHLRVPLWHAKLTNIMLNEVRNDVMAYLFVFSDYAIDGSVSNVELDIEYLF